MGKISVINTFQERHILLGRHFSRMIHISRWRYIPRFLRRAKFAGEIHFTGETNFSGVIHFSREIFFSGGRNIFRGYIFLGGVRKDSFLGGGDNGDGRENNFNR